MPAASFSIRIFTFSPETAAARRWPWTTTAAAISMHRSCFRRREPQPTGSFAPLSNGNSFGRFELSIEEEARNGGVGPGIAVRSAAAADRAAWPFEVQKPLVPVPPVSIKLDKDVYNTTEVLAPGNGVENQPNVLGKTFEIELVAGHSYRIDMRSIELDSYLIVYGADGRDPSLARDDDSGGGLNARILFTPPRTDRYRIVCTSFTRGQTGRFDLAIAELPPPIPKPAASARRRRPRFPKRSSTASSRRTTNSAKRIGSRSAT